MKIAVQIGEISNLGKTTIHLIKESLRRRYEIYIYSVSDLSNYNNALHAIAHKISLENDDILINQREEKINLDNYDLILMRNDPPFNMRYITATYLLEKCKAPVLNNPKSVRDFPEKIFSYPEYTLPTIISENIIEIEGFCSQNRPFIIKPLHEFGGRNVLKFHEYSESVESVMKMMLEKYNAPILVQQFSDKVLSEGDKRIVILDGEILGAFSRKSDVSFRVNMCLGGDASQTLLNECEKKICTHIATDLKKRNISLAGIDMIGEKVIEINVTSIAGIAELDRLYPGIGAARKYIDYCESVIG